MTVKGLPNMKHNTLRFASICVFSVAAAVLVAAGCGELLKGSSGANRLPEVFIVNIPPDGSEFAVSPTVYWYGTDSDGQIERYDYAVVIASEVDSIAADLPGNASAVEKYIAFVLNDQYPRWVSVFVDSAESGELPTQQDVRLFASRFPADCDTNYIIIRENGVEVDTIEQPVDCVSDTIPQYFFLRAIDDQGEASQIKYRTYKRRNHWPETEISRRFISNVEYISLRELTATYNGIELSWGGSDRLDFVPPTVPILEYHWRIYGPFPIDPNNPTVKPTLADTLGRQPIYESANRDPLQGVWVRDTSTFLYNLWAQADALDDPLNDTTVTRSAYFMFVVIARDDAYIWDETPAFTSFKALAPKFERKMMLLDETAYDSKAWANPATIPTRSEAFTNQAFLWDLVQSAYPEADTMQDFWWRNSSVPVGKKCNPPRVVCGNFVSLELLAKHRLCVIVSDDIWEPLTPPGQTPEALKVVRQYLDAGGMVWLIGRNALVPQSDICQACKERMFDFCAEDRLSYSQIACEYFDIEGAWYPGHRATALPPIVPPGELPRIPDFNDEFVSATMISPGSGLPPKLEIDRARVDSMFYPQYVKNIVTNYDTLDKKIIGVPEVNFLVLGSSSTPLYIFDSWRPGGPIPPFNAQSFVHAKPVMVRRVGPDRITPLYKTSMMTFPLYFLKQEQSEELFHDMVEWFFLPFSQS